MNSLMVIECSPCGDSNRCVVYNAGWIPLERNVKEYVTQMISGLEFQYHSAQSQAGKYDRHPQLVRRAERFRLRDGSPQRQSDVMRNPGVYGTRVDLGGRTQDCGRLVGARRRAFRDATRKTFVPKKKPAINSIDETTRGVRRNRLRKSLQRGMRDRTRAKLAIQAKRD